MSARMKTTSMLASVAVALLASVTVHAQTGPQSPYEVRAFTPAHPDLARSGGVPAELANQEYIEALARLVYYWGYPSVDVITRTSQWETMKQGPGTVLGIFPGGSVNTGGCLSDYMAPSQRMVVTPKPGFFQPPDPKPPIFSKSFVDWGALRLRKSGPGMNLRKSSLTSP